MPTLVAVIGTVAGGVALYFGFPGPFLVWLGLVVGAWSSSPPELSGKDPLTKSPIPLGPGEEALYGRYRFWRTLKWNLTLPLTAFVPGWWPRAAFFGALLAAAVAFSLPHFSLPQQYPGWLLGAISAFFTFVVVAQVCAARRDTVDSQGRSPGVRIDSLPKVGAESKKARLTIFGGAGAAGLAGSLAAGFFLPTPASVAALPGPVSAAAPATWFLLGAVLGFSAVVARPWVDTALEHWRLVCAARDEWSPRWQMLKHSAPPRLNDRELVGDAVIDYFTADGQMGGSAAYRPMGSKITPTMGRPARIAVLTSPTKDSTGQPMPGSVDANDFRIVTWPSDFQADLSDPDLDPAVAHLWLDCVLSWACDGIADPAPFVDEMTPLGVPSPPAPRHEPVTEANPDLASAIAEDVDAPAPPSAAPSEEPSLTAQAYVVTLHMPGGPGFDMLRKSVTGMIAAYTAPECLADHRKGGRLFIGALTEGQPDFDPEAGVTLQDLRNLDTEDQWVRRWAEVLKRDVNPPTIDHRVYSEETLASGAVLFRQAFVPRRGVDYKDFFGTEAKLAATFSGAPFVSVTGFTTTGRVGERHSQAFTVQWSQSNVPATPDKLQPLSAPERGGLRPSADRPGSRGPRAARGRVMPTHNDGYLWLLSGRLNMAFRACRMSQPETYSVRCLTRPDSRGGHLWSMRVRLYDGVTIGDVRTNAQRLKQALGTEWLRVEAVADGCTIVAGVDPRRASLAAPEKDERYLASLDWEQAFLDAKVSGVGGMSPTLIGVDRLPNNEQVHVLDFTLPTGLSFTDVKAAAKKLETSSKNAFVDVRRAPSGKAGEFRILASEVNPMPEQAGFDFEAADTGDHRIPFATNLFGEPTCYDNKTDPMLLVVGAAGGGKSVLLQNLIYGAVIRGWDLWVADPAKGGVDFQFSEEHARAFARDIWQTKGMITAIYDEVLRRKAINAEHNCGNYRDLPDEVRYNHTLIVLDEFTSMMIPEPIPKALDDSPETLQAVEASKALNAARSYVGTYVGKVVREARSTGFTMLLATQALKSDTLQRIPNSSDLKDNMSRAIMGRASFPQLMAALKVPTEAPEQPEAMPPGRGLYEGNGRMAEAVQVWFEGSQMTFRDQICERVLPLAPDRKLDLSPFVEPDLEVDGTRIDDMFLPPPPPPAPSPDEVIDLAPVALSLDDLAQFLDEDDADDDGAGPVDTPEHPTSASAPAEPDDWDAAPVTVAPAATQAKDESLSVASDLCWDEVDPERWMPVTAEYGWPEVDALLAFLDQFPGVREVTWTDEQLLKEDTTGVPYIELVTDLLAERGIDLVGPTSAQPIRSVPTPVPAATPVGAPASPPAHPSPVPAQDDDFGPTPPVVVRVNPADPFG